MTMGRMRMFAACRRPRAWSAFVSSVATVALGLALQAAGLLAADCARAEEERRERRVDRAPLRIGTGRGRARRHACEARDRRHRRAPSRSPCRARRRAPHAGIRRSPRTLRDRRLRPERESGRRRREPRAPALSIAAEALGDPVDSGAARRVRGSARWTDARTAGRGCLRDPDRTHCPRRLDDPRRGRAARAATRASGSRPAPARRTAVVGVGGRGRGAARAGDTGHPLRAWAVQRARQRQQVPTRSRRASSTRCSRRGGRGQRRWTTST